jgi:prepilin-type N-terminal cleavage/methylation domain-containing protein
MRSHFPATCRRRGFSIIEVIAAMVIGSTIFGLSVELLMLAKRETAIGSEQTVSAANLSRLGEQFRADVHAAETALRDKTPDGRVRWTMKMPDDKRVEYESSANGLQRTEYHGERAHARDAFALPAAGARIELKPTDKPVAATLIIKRGSSAADDAESELRIEAQVGRDLRFAKQ